MMLCFYTTRANFAILPHPNKASLKLELPVLATQPRQFLAFRRG